MRNVYLFAIVFTLGCQLTLDSKPDLNDDIVGAWQLCKIIGTKTSTLFNTCPTVSFINGKVIINDHVQFVYTQKLDSIFLDTAEVTSKVPYFFAAHLITYSIVADSQLILMDPSSSTEYHLRRIEE